MRLVISVFCLVSILGSSLASDVLQFGDSDFSNKLSDHDTALVMFYAPWCGHCKRLKPEFEKAASLLKDNDPPVALVKVDCTEEGKEICGKYGVSGYPTLKIFRNGELATDYNGPREVNGIVKYMRAQVGPATKDLTSVEEAEKFLSKDEVAIVYFGEGSLKDAFMKVANKLRETVRFGHSTASAVTEKYGFSNVIVLFRPQVMSNKFEDSKVSYDGAAEVSKIEAFINSNYHGLVGHRKPDNVQDFKSPLVVAYFNVDYIKNPKGTNYWRNRILKVAKAFTDDFTFAVASKDDFQHELNDYGFDFLAGDKPQICVKDIKEQKFIMKDEFSMENLESFLNNVKGGELEPYLKSEAIPDNDGKDVKVAVAKNFEDLVTNSGRDALIEFYAPWCGHCKKLTPIYDELGEKLRDEDVDIIKMDATANDVPQPFDVKGFPTIFWKPKSGKPVSFNGGRELDDFISYIAKHATDELRGYDRSGKVKKSEKEEL